MNYFDENEYRKAHLAFEQEVIRNYYRNTWIRLTGLRWDDRPESLKELHRSFETLYVNFPCDGEQADKFRAEMKRVLNALKIEYRKLERRKHLHDRFKSIFGVRLCAILSGKEVRRNCDKSVD